MANKDDIFDRVRVDKRPGRDVNLGRGRVASAYRSTKNMSQAVLKVSSYSSGVGRVGAHVDYISRDGDLDVEDPQGNHLADPEEINERINEWAFNFDKRKDSRDTVNIILSAPKGSELGAVENSVREFAKNTFGETNDYLFAIHQDTEHPHGHLMVKMRGYDGEKINPGRRDLKDWRMSFAQSLRDNGVEVDASSRSSRGVGRKGTNQSVYHIRGRGEIPAVDQNAKEQAVKDLLQNKQAKDKPWAKAAKKATKQHVKELKNIATLAKKAAKESDNKDLDDMANSIYRHAQQIPEPKTRNEVAEDKIQQQKEDIER